VTAKEDPAAICRRQYLNFACAKELCAAMKQEREAGRKYEKKWSVCATGCEMQLPMWALRLSCDLLRLILLWSLEWSKVSKPTGKRRLHYTFEFFGDSLLFFFCILQFKPGIPMPFEIFVIDFAVIIRIIEINGRLCDFYNLNESLLLLSHKAFIKRGAEKFFQCLGAEGSFAERER
jgi:hypothetical protein